MKLRPTMQASYCFIWKALVVATIVTLLGSACQTGNHGDSSLPSKVLRPKGQARYSNDDGKTWKAIKPGAFLQPGCLIQTALTSYVDISLGECVRPLLRNSQANAPNALLHYWEGPWVVRTQVVFDPAIDAAIVLRLLPGSLLKVEKLAGRKWTSSKEVVKEMLLDLRAGKIAGRVKKPGAERKYEIKFPNGIVRIQEASFLITSDGVLSVKTGKLSIISKDSNRSNEVTAGHGFDNRKGLIYELPNPEYELGSQ